MIDNADTTIIPALSGYNWLVARVDEHNDLVGIVHLPVLAWSFSHHFCCECDTEEMLVIPIPHREADLLALWKRKRWADFDDVKTTDPVI